MAIPGNQDYRLDQISPDSTFPKFHQVYSGLLWSLLVLGVSLGYTYILCHNLFMALIILAILFLIFISLINVSQLFFIFPITYAFTFFSIPLIGSPEKLLGVIVLFVFVAKLMVEGRLLKFHAGMILAFILYILAHFPALMGSIGSLKNNLAGIISHSSMGVFVYLVVNFIREQKQVEKCVAGIVALNLIVFVFIFFLVINYTNWGFYRDPEVNYLLKANSIVRYTFMNNPNRLCRVVLMTYPFVILFYLYSKTHLEKFLGMILCVSIPCIVVITFSRMGLIALVLILVLLYLKYRNRTKLVFLLLIFFIAAGAIFSSMIILRFARLHEQREVYGEVKRYSTWKSGVQAWLEHPLFGVGAGKKAIYKAMEKHGATKYDHDEMAEVAKAPHSVYLNTLLETGAIGFAALGLFFYQFVRFMKKTLKLSSKQTYLHDFMQLGFISLLSALLMGITANSIWLNIFWYIVGLLYAGARIISNSNTINSARVNSGDL